MATLQQIEKQTGEYAATRTWLRDKVVSLNDEIEATKKKALPGIKKAAEAAAAEEVELRALVEESPELFKKPRTLTLHGIKVGFQKAKGALLWDNDNAVVKAIKKLFPEAWEGYMQVTEKPLKSALANLPANDLKKLGVTVTNDTDEVLIKSTDSDIDKLVSALIKTDDEE